MPAPAQILGINRAKFHDPTVDSLVADVEATFGQQVFNVPQAQAEPNIQPNCMLDDVWWKMMAGM